MKAIAKVIDESEQKRRANHTSTGWSGAMTALMGKEITVRKHDSTEDTDRFIDEDDWVWEEGWLEFKKEDGKVEEKKVNKTIEKLEKDIEATKKSLLKWKINTALLEDGTREGVKITASECPLCNLYSCGTGVGGRCDGCPIKERSGRTACAGTPYEQCAALMNDDKLDKAAIESALEVDYLTEILIDLRRRLAVEKDRADRPPYHRDFDFIPTYKNTGIAKFVKVCIQSKKQIKDGFGNTETVVIDDIDDCRDDDDRYAFPVTYEVGLVDEDDEYDMITSFPTIKDAITYAGKFGCDVIDAMNKQIREGSVE